MIAEVCSAGLLHSDICGSKRTYRSPQLIAVNHVLRRLPMPRHSPCALCCFTICFMFHEFSKNCFLLNTCSFLPDKISLIVFLLVVSSFALLLLYSVFKFLFSVPENRYQQQFPLLLISTLGTSRTPSPTYLFLVGTNGLEPSTSRLSGVRSNHLSYAPVLLRASALSGGDEEDRTPDPLRARQMLSQLSYTPIFPAPSKSNNAK